MSVTAVVKIRIKPGCEAAFLDAMAVPVQRTRDNPECSQAELYQQQENPLEFLLLEVWTSIEAHGAHFQTLMDDGVLEACLPTWDGMPASTHYSALD